MNPEYSLKGLRLALQYFGHLLRSIDTWEKALMLGKIEGKKRRAWQSIRWLDSITDSTDMKDREAWHATVHGVSKSWT